MTNKKPKKINPDVCRAFGLVNSKTQTIWKNKTKIISVFDENGSKTKRFRKPERSDVNEAFHKPFKSQRRYNVPVSWHLLIIIFVLPQFKFGLMYFCRKPVRNSTIM